MYSLPHPSVLFHQRLPKERFKSMMKKKIIDFWEILLRKEAENLRSLTFFKPEFMSVTTPHPLWVTAGHSPIKVAMATVQATFLSGRYRCGKLTRHWSAGDGSCAMSSSCSGILEDIPHIILWCPSLTQIRQGLYAYTLRYTSNLPLPLMVLLRTKFHPDNPTFIDCILDCSIDSQIIKTTQELGGDVLRHAFAVSRTWAYVLHRERMGLLGLWRPMGY